MCEKITEDELRITSSLVGSMRLDIRTPSAVLGLTSVVFSDLHRTLGDIQAPCFKAGLRKRYYIISGATGLGSTSVCRSWA